MGKTLNELSKDHLKKYINKSVQNVVNATSDMTAADFEDRTKDATKQAFQINRRKKGIDMAAKKLSEAQEKPKFKIGQLVHLKNKTNPDSPDRGRIHSMTDTHAILKTTYDRHKLYKAKLDNLHTDKEWVEAWKAKKAIQESENLDELSFNKVDKYFTQASADRSDAEKNSDSTRQAKRQKGLGMAINNLRGKISEARQPHPALQAAQKNAEDIRDGKYKDYVKPKPHSFGRFGRVVRDLEKADKEKIREHQAKYDHHKNEYKNASDSYDDVASGRTGHTEENMHGALEEVQGMLDHHSEKMYYHLNQMHRINSHLDKPLKIKEDVQSDRKTLAENRRIEIKAILENSPVNPYVMGVKANNSFRMNLTEANLADIIQSPSGDVGLIVRMTEASNGIKMVVARKDIDLFESEMKPTIHVNGKPKNVTKNSLHSNMQKLVSGQMDIATFKRKTRGK